MIDRYAETHEDPRSVEKTVNAYVDELRRSGSGPEGFLASMVGEHLHRLGFKKISASVDAFLEGIKGTGCRYAASQETAPLGHPIP